MLDNSCLQHSHSSSSNIAYLFMKARGETCMFAIDGWDWPVDLTNFMKKTLLCSAVLAHFILKERLHIFGMLGCALCVVGSTTIVLHAPKERHIESVKQVSHLATEPGM